MCGTEPMLFAAEEAAALLRVLETNYLQVVHLSKQEAEQAIDDLESMILPPSVD